MATTHQRTANLDTRIAAPLAALRRRVRRYVWLHGLSSTAAAAGTVFWLSLVIDWFFEPAVGFRAVLLPTALAAIAAVAVNLIVRRLRTPMTDANMAMLLERRFSHLDDTLLTAVTLDEDHVDAFGDGLGNEMLARTSREAARRLDEAKLAEVFNPVPMRRSMLAAVAMIVSISLFAILTPNSLETWARRSFMFSNEPWPRRTKLIVEGFEGHTCKVARGANFEVVVKANRNKPLVPKTVEIRYQTDSGARGRASMNRDGEAVLGRDPFQRYTHTFRGILSPITFDLVGGDDRIDDLRIEVVESPKIDRLQLACTYPEYMARPPRTLSVIGPMEIPRNTRLRVEGLSNKPLVDVRVDQPTADGPTQSIALEPAKDDGEHRKFYHDLGTLEKDVTLFFTLRDSDGIASPEPTRLVLLAVDDEPPELSVSLSGIGTAITPKARLPVVGQARDDHGIAEVWFEHAANKADPVRRSIVRPQGNATELAIDDALDARDLGLVPGQKFDLILKASDRYDLEPAPRVGESQRWQLDVVTPDQLRTMLQNRELTLRHRFEQIIQEVKDTHEALIRIDSASSTSKPKKESDKKPSDSNDGSEPGDKPVDWSGREPGDQPDRPGVPSENQQRRLATASLHCERAVQNSRKNANETLGVAEAFDDLRLQLINNRIDTEELKIRLRSGVADPLRVIAETMFPELDRRLVALREALDDDHLRPARREHAQAQVNDILTAMNRVLSRMMELEDFNEAIELLQEIIKAQEKLENEIKQRQKAQLRDLLEE